MKLGSFCTGFGGLDLAVELFYDAELSWYSEIDRNCKKLLEIRYPGVTNIGDLTTLDFKELEPVDIICAGFPCQPFSDAGARKGDKDERAIFQYIADSIGVLRPPIVVLENVAGILTLGGTGVIGALTEIGYDARWEIVRASDVGACHQRARWFCVASDSNSDRKRGGQSRKVREQGNNERQINKVRPDGSNSVPDSLASNSDSLATKRGAGAMGGKSGGLFKEEGLEGQKGGNSSFNEGQNATDSDSSGFGKQCSSVSVEQTHRPAERSGSQVDWGDYARSIRRWELIIGRQAPNPVVDSKLSSKFVEWMMGLPEGWVTDLNLPRTSEMKMLGNGVVVQQALLALEVLNEQ